MNWSPNVLEIDFLYRFEQVMWSSDGTQLFTTHVTNESSVPSSIPSFGNIVRRWDADTGELLKEFTRFEQAFFTAKGSELIVISRSDNQLSVWEAESEETFWSLPDIYFIGAVFTDEVQRLAVASIEEGEMVISVWDVSSNNRLLDLEGKYRLSVNLSPNGHSLQLINNDDFSSEIWDLRTGQQIELSVVDGYTLNSAYWSPDGECIISIGSQNLSSEGVKTTALILWRTADPDNLRILDTSEFGFNGVAWSTDSKQIAVINRTEISSEPHLQGEVYPSPPPAYSTLVKLWK